MEKFKCDILIIGLGSAGFGALYGALKRAGSDVRVVAVERNGGMGGMSVYGGVNCWEPGIGGPGVHAEIAARLLRRSMAAGVGRDAGGVTEQARWAFSRVCGDPYRSTLKRAGGPFAEFGGQRRFQFEPDDMRSVMEELTEPFGNKTLLYNSRVTSVRTENGRITSVTAEISPETSAAVIEPKLVIDCSGDIAAARLAGCGYAVGEEPRSRYREPGAPNEPSGTVNGVTQVFRVSPCEEGYVQELPPEYEDIDVSDWLAEVRRTNLPVSCFNVYPNGDINVNMLPTMEGAEYLGLGEKRAARVCAARAYAYWRWVTLEKGFAGYGISRIFPTLGVRESFRLVGKYVLTESDVRAGYEKQNLRGRIIAFGDHALDTHGRGTRCAELELPYGIPYDCMLPREVGNLLVACRGSSFSHIASSSARLSRTMLALGEAAGCAAVIALENGVPPGDIDVSELRRRLGITEFEPTIREIYNQRA